MSDTIIPQGKHVAYDRETRDHAAYYNGELIGYRATRAEAEALANQHALAELQSQPQGGDCPLHGPYAGDHCPKCKRGER